MAQFPCDHCGQRYGGPQQTAYPAIVDGAQAQRGKQRLCPKCLQKLTGWIQERLVPGADPAPVELCSACAAPDPTLAIFVTLYRTGNEREDWFGRMHDGACLSPVRMALFGSTAAP